MWGWARGDQTVQSLITESAVDAKMRWGGVGERWRMRERMWRMRWDESYIGYEIECVGLIAQGAASGFEWVRWRGITSCRRGSSKNRISVDGGRGGVGSAELSALLWYAGGHEWDGFGRIGACVWAMVVSVGSVASVPAKANSDNWPGEGKSVKITTTHSFIFPPLLTDVVVGLQRLQTKSRLDVNKPETPGQNVVILESICSVIRYDRSFHWISCWEVVGCTQMHPSCLFC